MWRHTLPMSCAMLVVVVAWCTGARADEAAPASATEARAPAHAGPLDDMVFDRVDGQREVWRLSDFVVTHDGAPPAQPRPVYVQFGFMGCAPCEVLATTASAALPGHVEKVYVHLDDVLLDDATSLRQLWGQLFRLSQRAPYTDFSVLRRGSVALMTSLCGADAQPPSALLIGADGGVFATMRSPSDEDAQRTFRAFARANPTSPSASE